MLIFFALAGAVFGRIARASTAYAGVSHRISTGFCMYFPRFRRFPAPLDNVAGRCYNFRTPWDVFVFVLPILIRVKTKKWVMCASGHGQTRKGEGGWKRYGRPACPIRGKCGGRADGWRLCDTFAAGKMETCELRDGVAPPWIPDYVTKCARCKREIGIHKEV